MSNIDKWAGLDSGVFVHSGLGVGMIVEQNCCMNVDLCQYIYINFPHFNQQHVVTFLSLNISVKFLPFYSFMLYSILYYFMFNIALPTITQICTCVSPNNLQSCVSSVS